LSLSKPLFGLALLTVIVRALFASCVLSPEMEALFSVLIFYAFHFFRETFSDHVSLFASAVKTF